MVKERERGGSCDDDYIPPLLFLRGSSEVRGWDRAQSPDAFNLPSRLSCFLSLSFSPATAVTFRHHPLTSKGCWLFARSFLQSTERERGMLSTSRVSFMDITRIIPRSMVFFKWTDEIPFLTLGRKFYTHLGIAWGEWISFATWNRPARGASGGRGHLK